MQEMTMDEVESVSGAGIWYELGYLLGSASRGAWDYPMAGNYALGA